ARHVPERRVHPARQPRRDPRDQRPVRADARRPARRLSDHGAAARRGALLRPRRGLGSAFAGARARPTLMSLDVVPLDASRLDAWTALMRAAGSACFCRYWHFAGDKNAWLERCAERPCDNLDETSALVRARDPAARGLLALEGAAAVGWMKLAPR